MRFTILAGFALAATLFGCAASSEAPSDPTPTTQSSVDKFSIPTTPIYPLWDYNNNRLYVAVCPLAMPMPNNVDQAHEDADCVEVTPAKIQLVNVLATDPSGHPVGDSVVEDRPGGGCVHVDLPGLAAGSTLRVLALVEDVPGKPGKLVAFANVTTTSGP